jgi:endoglycosylceramidase
MLCLAAACGDDGGQPRPTPTSTATATSSATLTPTAVSTATATVPPASATVTRTATPRPPTTTATATVTPTDTPAAIPTLEPLTIHADADWIRDAQGRVVLLRGANYSGIEFGNFIGNTHGPEESDFAQMETWGFNVIRLPIAWSYMEPEPNVFDDRYLFEQVDPVVDWADRHGMVVVLEMHQFFWSPCIGGNGAPAWACEGRNYGTDIFGAIRAGCEFVQGLAAPDGRTLQEHFLDVWRIIARHYRGDRRIAGLNMLNEPQTVACPGGAANETFLLYDLYRRWRTLVQAEGALQTFFAEPPVARNIGFPVITADFSPDVVYAPHLYTQTGGSADIKYDGNAATITADYEVAAREAREFGGPLFAGEFGGNTNLEGDFRPATEAFLRDSLDEQDRRLLGGAVWAYFPSDNTFSVVDADGNEKGDLVNIVARPYARRIAGVPTEMRWDPAMREFVFSWRVEAGQQSDVTEVFVPNRHFPLRFIELPPGVVQSARPEEQTVLFRALAPGDYTIRIKLPLR